MPSKSRRSNNSIYKQSQLTLKTESPKRGIREARKFPHSGDHRSWQRKDNQLNAILYMPPKYDLILQKDDKIKIKQIMAVDIEDAIAKGKLERSDLKGVVFSDQNKESSM